jgi:hypothetical protein
MNSKMVKRLVVCLLLLGIASSNGCMFQIAPLVKIPFSASGYESNEVAIAVGPDGKIHIARTECPTGTKTGCRLVYTTVMGGIATNVYILPLGSNISDPDIAVTAGGVAYYVFRSYSYSGHINDYWMASSNLSMINPVDHLYESAGPPKIAAYGNAVYVVYEADMGGGVENLRYKQINGGSSAGRIAWGPGMGTVSRVQPTVSPAGKLYVTWALDGSATPINLSTNYDSTGDITTGVNIGAQGVNAYEAPVDLNEAGNWVYTAATISATSDQILVSRYQANNILTLEGIIANMPIAKSWHIWQPLCMQATQNTVYVALVASNTDTSLHFELFYWVYTFGTGNNGEPIQITNSVEGESPPECAYYNDGTEAGFVISWRIQGAGTYGNIYVWDVLNQSNRLVHSSGANGREGFEMAGNGRFVAGIANILTSGKITPWVGYNAELVYLPIVRK